MLMCPAKTATRFIDPVTIAKTSAKMLRTIFVLLTFICSDAMPTNIDSHALRRAIEPLMASLTAQYN